MTDALRVLIASRDEAGLKEVEKAVSPVPRVSAESILMVNGNHDPLRSLTYRPDVLILRGSNMLTEQLKALLARAEDQLPFLMVVGNGLPAEAVKYAARAGAREILEVKDMGELADGLRKVAAGPALNKGPGEGRILSVMNAKGGSGATFIASNIAHLGATSAPGDTAIIDLDFQFGSLVHYFDLAPERGLLEALKQVHELDNLAIEAFTAKHSSGMRLMAPLPDVEVVVDFDVPEHVRLLLPILKSRFANTVFDVPRHIDEVSAPVLRDSDEIVIVLQQSLPSVRDALRLKNTLVSNLEIGSDMITYVVNRHLKGGSIEVSDIKEALGLNDGELVLIPNHFKAVGQAIDVGKPIAEIAAGSPVTKALQYLQRKLMKIEQPAAVEQPALSGVAPQLGPVATSVQPADNRQGFSLGRFKIWSLFRQGT